MKKIILLALVLGVVKAVALDNKFPDKSFRRPFSQRVLCLKASFFKKNMPISHHTISTIISDENADKSIPLKPYQAHLNNIRKKVCAHRYVTACGHLLEVINKSKETK